MFIIYDNKDYCSVTHLTYARRDFYKITFVTKGEGIIMLGDEKVRIKDNVLALFNPWVPYSWEPVSTDFEGWSCLFTEEFIAPLYKTSVLTKAPLFKIDGNHLLLPEQESVDVIAKLFSSINNEVQSTYQHKYELLLNYVQIILHEALKMDPIKAFVPPGTSNARITSMFINMLEEQFTIIDKMQSIPFKNANEFADKLAVHANHLNRVLKETIGNTTSELIAKRTSREAKTLLRHSDWDISEIAYTLGFEHASNFNTFFKKQNSLTPNEFRKMQRSAI